MKNMSIFLILLSIILISGCTIKDIPGGTFGVVHSQMAGLDINEVQFVSASISESGDFLSLIVIYEMNIENKVKVESSVLGYPSRIINDRAYGLYFNNVEYSTQTILQKIALNPEGQKIPPTSHVNIEVKSEFKLPAESIKNTGEINLVIDFTEQADGDPNIKKMGDVILTTIKYSQKSRSTDYETEGVSEIVPSNNPLLKINVGNI